MDKNLKVGQRVELIGKNVKGRVAYVGMTSFATGKWVGVILDEAKGKNNGIVKGQQYFNCPENFGMFVRPTQLQALIAHNESSEDLADGSFSGDSQVTKPQRSRLSGSRQSLSSSRQSLIGSRSQLSATSLTEKSNSSLAGGSTSGRKSLINPPSALPTPTTTTAGESHSSSKRASFVETGFLEILKPQFTPSQPTTTTIEDKVNAIEQQKLIDDLKAQVNDLTEKLESIKQRRVEDKDRLREYDKMKIQFEQLQEFKSKIMDAQALLQRELQRAKQETKDAIEAKERHAQDMADLSDNMEMITLDKEMAEEKAETLQLELETARERIEELTLDLELIQTEMQNKTENGHIVSNGTTSAYELKQLEQQNLRLKETLVRLRDLSAHEKHDIQKLSKELEMKRSEVTELERTKEKLSKKIDELEAAVADLHEQVDAALGAEEMVEQLAVNKIELEDKLKFFEEEVAELEALHDIHEQLIESNHDLELDLREELDMTQMAKNEVVREKEAALETIYDRDQTILKFRELVQKLNEQIMQLRDKNNENNAKIIEETTKAADAIDYNQMFAESKAFTRAIDVQLRQIELTQANERVQMLTAYMPESFMNRGGDNDAILVILLVSRIVFKCGIIISQTRERFPPVENINQDTIFQGHTVQQFEFKSRLLHYIHNLQCAMHQIMYGLNSCKPDTLLRAGSSLPEMFAQEKAIDSTIDLLKSNQLDENSSTDAIEKCVAFFNAMNSVLFDGEDLLNETQMIRDCVASLTSSCDAILTDAQVIRSVIRNGDSSNSVLLMQYVIENANSIKQSLKLVKRRLPKDMHVIKCGLAPATIKNLRDVTNFLSKIMSAIHLATKQTIQAITTTTTSDNDTNVVDHSIEHEKFWELLSIGCERVYEQDDRGPSINFKGILASANTDIAQLAQYLLDKEYEIMSNAYDKKIEKTEAPILLRAQNVKKQIEQKNVLTVTLENRDAEIKQLKLAAKMKQNELSEMQIRKDLAEKKLSVLQHDHDITIEKLKNQYDDTCELLKKKEKEFEDTMDHLQSDIEALETEKSTLREKLKSNVGPKGIIDSIGGNGITISSNIDGSTNPHTTQEVHLYKNLFLEERQRRIQYESNEIKKAMKRMEPIYVPQAKDERIIKLEQKLAKLKNEWTMSLISMTPVPKKPTDEVLLQAKVLATEILNEYLSRHPHRAVSCDFSSFPKIETQNVLGKQRQ